jgi:polyhydroxybutyrate depolymerase
MSLRTCSWALLSAAFLLGVGCGSGNADTSSTGTTTAMSTGGSGGSGGAGGATGATGGTGGATAGAGGTGGATTGTTGTGGDPVIGGDRPVKMYISSKYDPSKPAPLLILLHGYGASGKLQEQYFALHDIADQRGYIYGVPDGTLDSTQKRFWNATDACCNFGDPKIDDSAYLSGVVDEIKKYYNIDPKRVYFVGHSNGGFMSYRMACDHADKIAAIVSLAGATWADDSKCQPSEPVAVAQIHGTADDTVLYPGGKFGGVLAYPGALQDVQLWAAHDGCNATPSDGGKKDLEASIAGQETDVSIYGEGCKPGGHVELWTVNGGGHIPSITQEFRTDVFDFLDAHPKP